MIKETADKFSGRRTFLKKSALLGLGFIVSPIMLPGFRGSTALGHFAKIAPTAFLDDCFRIIVASDEIGNLVKAILRSNIYEHLPGNTARLGRIFPAPLEHGASLLVSVKKRLAMCEDQIVCNEMLAFGLGVLASIGYEKSFQKDLGVREAGIYLDAAILKDMNGLDPGKSIKGNHEEFADLLRSLSTRFLTRIHTVIPDDEDAEEWILRVDHWRRDLDSYYTELSRVYLDPVKEKYNEFILGQRLYLPSDPIIKLVRDIQRSTTEGVHLVSGIFKTRNRSAYARAIETTYTRILAADKFLNDTIDEAEFRKRLSN